MVAFPKPKPINLTKQMLALQQAFPAASCAVHRNQLTWRAELSPTPMSTVYAVSLDYSLEVPPVVRVVTPELADRSDAEVPHVYPDGSLCLYYPKAREFTRDQLLVETIVPWTSEWLMHYELWQATGEWLGGGIHPGDAAPIQYSE